MDQGKTKLHVEEEEVVSHQGVVVGGTDLVVASRVEEVRAVTFAEFPDRPEGEEGVVTQGVVTAQVEHEGAGVPHG